MASESPVHSMYAKTSVLWITVCTVAILNVFLRPGVIMNDFYSDEITSSSFLRLGPDISLYCFTQSSVSFRQG